MRIITALHARTDWNDPERGKLQGQTDISLNNTGRAEAAALAESLAELGITYLISSDLLRAWQTAEIIAARLRVPLYPDERLRECSFGSLEGLPKSDLQIHYQPLRHDGPGAPWHGSYAAYDFTPFGGESRDEVLRRHLAVLQELRGDGVPLLVGHGCGLGTLLHALGERPPLERGAWREIEYPSKTSTT